MGARAWRGAPCINPLSLSPQAGSTLRGDWWRQRRSGLGLVVGGNDLAKTALGTRPRGPGVAQRHAHATDAFGACAGEIGEGGGGWTWVFQQWTDGWGCVRSVFSNYPWYPAAIAASRSVLSRSKAFATMPSPSFTHLL